LDLRKSIKITQTLMPSYKVYDTKARISDWPGRGSAPTRTLTELNLWNPTIPLNDQIAADLITARFPELEPVSIRLLGSGWDNHAYLVNESVVIRIPHRDVGGALMKDECRVLSYLAEFELPLKIPKLCCHAPEDETFPYTIAGYPLLCGETADNVVWTDAQRAGCAEPLGRFLGALHRLPIGMEDPPVDELRRADISFRVPTVLEKLGAGQDDFREVLIQLASTPAQDSPPSWVHGDLYSRHLLVDESRSVVGVIDWGDSHVGDPALDIAIAWMFLPPASWPAFLDAYGGVDDATWGRARFRAIAHCVYLQGFAQDREDEGLLRELEFVGKNVLRAS